MLCASSSITRSSTPDASLIRRCQPCTMAVTVKINPQAVNSGSSERSRLVVNVSIRNAANEVPEKAARLQTHTVYLGRFARTWLPRWKIFTPPASGFRAANHAGASTEHSKCTTSALAGSRMKNSRKSRPIIPGTQHGVRRLVRPVIHRDLRSGGMRVDRRVRLRPARRQEAVAVGVAMVRLSVHGVIIVNIDVITGSPLGTVRNDHMAAPYLARRRRKRCRPELIETIGDQLRIKTKNDRGADQRTNEIDAADPCVHDDLAGGKFIGFVCPSGTELSTLRATNPLKNSHHSLAAWPFSPSVYSPDVMIRLQCGSVLSGRGSVVVGVNPPCGKQAVRALFQVLAFINFAANPGP